jgi:hypothetical protein
MTKKIEAGAIADDETIEPSAKAEGSGRSKSNGNSRRRGIRVRRVLVAAGLLVTGFALAQAAGAQTPQKLGSAPPVTYDNRYEVYGSLNLMNFQAGQNLPKRMNLGGGEFLGTYWLTRKWGLGAEYRGEAGTTPVFPNAEIYGIHRPLVYMNMGLAGAQYRGPKNQYAAINYHAYGGLAHGVFDAGTAGAGPGAQYTTPAQNAQLVGLYSNRTSPIFAIGGSLDLNRSKNWALRLSPDLILEHFGTETREFFAISGGIVYRIPNRKKK